MDAHVALVANEGYVKGLAVTLKSLLDSLRNASAVGRTRERATCLSRERLRASADQTETVSTVYTCG
jgi:lipopolysaccharide biosynthesis glycosyltransferase